MNTLILYWIKTSILWQFLRINILMLKCLIGKEKFTHTLDIISVIYYSSRVSLLKTIYINCRLLSVRDAIKMPIVVYNNVQILNLSGSARFEDCEISSCMIEIGKFTGYRSQGKTRIMIKGNIVFHGGGRILQGAELILFNKWAKLEIGESFLFAENVMVYCSKSIILGKFCRLNYHSQIMDSDFHFMLDIKKKEIKDINREIIIGDYNWFANKTTIKKGTHTPDYLTVAGSYCVLSKDYSSVFPPFSVVGGAPIQILAENKSRILKNEFDRLPELKAYFIQNPGSHVYHLKNDENIDKYIYLKKDLLTNIQL